MNWANGALGLITFSTAYSRVRILSNTACIVFLGSNSTNSHTLIMKIQVLSFSRNIPAQSVISQVAELYIVFLLLKAILGRVSLSTYEYLMLLLLYQLLPLRSDPRPLIAHLGCSCPLAGTSTMESFLLHAGGHPSPKSIFDTLKSNRIRSKRYLFGCLLVVQS